MRMSSECCVISERSLSLSHTRVASIRVRLDVCFDYTGFTYLQVFIYVTPYTSADISANANE